MPRPRLALVPLAALAALGAPPPRVAAAQSPTGFLDTVRTTAASRAGTMAQLHRSVEVIDRATIERRAARSVGDLLAGVLGADVQWRSPAQADFALRAGTPGQVLLLVDGVRQSDLQTAHFDLDVAVPLDAIERIEVVRGPGSALFGADAVGGVVNIVTRRDVHATSARLSGGSFGTAGASVAAAIPVGAGSVRASAEGERSDGHRTGTDYRVSQLRLATDQRTRAGRVEFDAGLARRDFGAAQFYAPAPSFERTRTAQGALRWTSEAGNAWTRTLVASVRRHTDDFILRRADPSYYRNRHENWQSALEGTVRRQLRGDAAVAIGGELFDAQLASARLGDRREQRAALFGEGSWGSREGASLSAGARADWTSTFGAIVSPQLGAALALGERRWLRASLARGYRAPSWTDRYYTDPANVGDPLLGAERFWAGELGLRALPRWGSIDVAAFARQADDLIDWTRPAGAPDAGGTPPWRASNVGSGRYLGAEGSIALPRIAGTEASVHASALHFRSSRGAGLEGKYALRPLTHVVGGTLTRGFGRGVSATVDLRQARRTGEQGWTMANARLAWQRRGATVTWDLTNIGDAAFLDAAGMPVASRAMFVGVHWGR
ncbi:MAG: TonB-dependent receptor plug domain-containing protein [Gemmatimonadaceae bacterium]